MDDRWNRRQTLGKLPFAISAAVSEIDKGGRDAIICVLNQTERRIKTDQECRSKIIKLAQMYKQMASINHEL